MKSDRMYKKPIGLGVSIAVCLLLLVTVGLVPAAHAAERLDPEHAASLTLEYRYEGRNLSNADFHLYRVAEISDSAWFTLSGSFISYPVKLNGLDSAGWDAAANTLATYVTADKIEALESKTTDQMGKLKFDTTQTGLYLVTGDRIEIGKTTYTVKPFLVSLPVRRSDGTWLYDVTGNPKCSAKTHSTPDGGDDGNVDYTHVEVYKVWEDEGNPSARPSQIEVSLLRDGAVYDTVVLNEENFWRYAWNQLEDKNVWNVVETTVPEDYMVTYTGSETKLVITNSLSEEIVDEPPPGADIDPLVDIPDEPTPTGTLPQTGLLWWPIPLLALLGLTLFGIGWMDAFRERRKRE